MKNKNNLTTTMIAIATVALVISGCAGTLDNQDDFIQNSGSNCTQTVNSAITLSCATSGCHDQTSQAANVDLSGTDYLTILSNSGQTSNSAGCVGEPIVSAGNGVQSLLYLKLLDSPDCGIKMPIGGSAWTPEEQSCLIELIDDL